MVEDQTEWEDIGSWRNTSSDLETVRILQVNYFKNLRRHESARAGSTVYDGCTSERRIVSSLVNHATRSKITQLGDHFVSLRALLDQYILRLDVSVYDTWIARVQEIDTCHDLFSNIRAPF